MGLISLMGLIRLIGHIGLVAFILLRPALSPKGLDFEGLFSITFSPSVKEI